MQDFLSRPAHSHLRNSTPPGVEKSSQGGERLPTGYTANQKSDLSAAFLFEVLYSRYLGKTGNITIRCWRRPSLFLEWHVHKLLSQKHALPPPHPSRQRSCTLP